MADHNLLLQEIKKGKRLRPTKTDDKSHPIVQTEDEKQGIIKVDAATDSSSSDIPELPKLTDSSIKK